MDLPDLPAEFSAEARTNVVNAEIRASRAMREAIRTKPWMTTLTSGSRPSGNKQVLELYVLPVFLAFAKEVCKLRHATKPWFSDQIKYTVSEFLRKLVVSSAHEFDRTDYPVHRMTSNMGSLEKFASQFVEQSVEWKEYEDLLLKLDEPRRPAKPESEARIESSNSSRLARLTSLLGHLDDQDHFVTVKSNEPNGKISTIHWAAIDSFLTKTVQYLGSSMRFTFTDDPIAVRSHIRAVRALLEDEIHRISPSQLKEQSRPDSTYESERSASPPGLSSDGPIESKIQSRERQLLRRSYFEHFANSEKIVILDFCWAAKQHYRDWTRWLQGEKAKRPIKDGHKADRAFRAILASKKRPEEFRTELRPTKWK